MRSSCSPAIPLIFLCILGCQKGPTPVKVSGRVTLDNRPLANAHVMFHSLTSEDKPDPDKESAGQTDSEGRYSLKTPGSNREGTMPGTYRVEIHVIDRSGTGKVGIHELLPPQYNRNSKLTFSVPPEGASEANFDLKSK